MPPTKGKHGGGTAGEGSSDQHGPDTGTPADRSPAAGSRRRRTHLTWGLEAAVCVAVSAGLVALGRQNYLAFHSLAELFSVVVGAALFTIVWHTRRLHRDGAIVMLGVAYLAVAAVDLAHTLAYQGMGVFSSYSANLPTQLWIAARYIESLSLLAAMSLRRDRPAAVPVLLLPLVAAALLVALVFTGAFPDCFVPGHGLTGFKVVSEHVIAAVLVAAAAVLIRKRRHYDRRLWAMLLGAIALTVAAELAFTLYAQVDDWKNQLGHMLKLGSFYLLYRALLLPSLTDPFRVLFRRLRDNERALAEDNVRLSALRAELQEKNDRLLVLDAKKNELLGIAAHDIRSPLGVIRMYAQILEHSLAGGSVDNPTLLRHVQAIARRADFSLRLVDEVLDVTAIAAGELRLKLQPLDLAQVVLDRVELNRLVAQNKQTRIQYTTQPGLPTVQADPTRLREVADNLLSNAVKYSPPGSEILVELKQDGEAVVLAVADEGPGITANEQDLLFQPFGRTSAQTTDGEPSTGLGLAIVSKIVQGHNGRVWVESEPGQGATFFVSLPL